MQSSCSSLKWCSHVMRVECTAGKQFESCDSHNFLRGNNRYHIWMMATGRFPSTLDVWDYDDSWDSEMASIMIRAANENQLSCKLRDNETSPKAALGPINVSVVIIFCDMTHAAVFPQHARNDKHDRRVPSYFTHLPCPRFIRSHEHKIPDWRFIFQPPVSLKVTTINVDGNRVIADCRSGRDLCPSCCCCRRGRHSEASKLASIIGSRIYVVQSRK